jgi:hypothetical protein
MRLVKSCAGYADIMGLSFATNSVTVNSQTAYRKGEYFRKELPVNNASASLWTNIIVVATGQTSVTGNLFVAKSPETFGYDADGNMTNDGRWSLTWDAENRLTKARCNELAKYFNGIRRGKSCNCGVFCNADLPPELQ